VTVARRPKRRGRPRRIEAAQASLLRKPAFLLKEANFYRSREVIAIPLESETLPPGTLITAAGTEATRVDEIAGILMYTPVDTRIDAATKARLLGIDGSKRRGRPSRVQEDILLWGWVRYWQGRQPNGVRLSVTQALERAAHDVSRESGRSPSVATLRTRFYRMERRGRADPEFAKLLFEAEQDYINFHIEINRENKP
jgi:hypothetical protein